MPNEVEIAIAPDRLTAHDIGLNELAQRLQTLNFSVSAGEIEDGGRRLRVQPVGEIVDLQQLRDVVINEDGLRLGDIATVQLKSARLDMGRRLEGRPAVGRSEEPTPELQSLMRNRYDVLCFKKKKTRHISEYH